MRRRSLTTFIIFLLAILATSRAQTYTESLLYSFSQQPTYDPLYGVIQASDGNFYGTTNEGGSQGAQGIAFRLTPAGKLTTLYTFCSQGGGYCTDGSTPFGLVEGPDGNFYGATLDGGTDTQGGGNYGGTVFRITPSGVYTVLYNFCGVAQCADGAFPSGSVIFGSDGNMYGATSEGGQFGFGSVFRLTTSGSLDTLYSFCPTQSCTDGYGPATPLLQAADGNFYGTTVRGGANGAGVIYKISSGGTFAALGSFDYTQSPLCNDDGLCAPLLQAADGNFYSTLEFNGAQDEGLIFRATPAGAISTIYSFCSKGSAPTCADGATPLAPLVAGTDGNLYGVTVGGGPGGSTGGTFFRVNTAGALTTLYSFCAANPDSCTTAGDPGPIQQGADGNFYGTSANGGANEFWGSVFKLTSSAPIAAPVQLTLSSSSVSPGAALTRNWKVSTAYSTTLQQCYFYLTSGTTITALGKLDATFSAGSASGSASITAPTSTGAYTYGLTCGGAESGFATLTVAGTSRKSSTTTLAATPNPASLGQSVTLKATITGSGAAPTGTVTFDYGSESLAIATIKSGAASFAASTNGLPPGTYPITAKYSGDSNYNPSSGTASVKLNSAPTTTTLTASPTTVTPPASVTLTATVKRSATGSTGTPTGSVTFYADGTDALATVKLNANGIASLTASSKGYPAGKYPITAKYLGDASDTTSTSSSVTVTVQ